MWSVSGHVKKPGVYEIPMGYADMEKFIFEDCGGMLREDKKLKAVIPGGSSVYIMNAGQILGKNVTLDYEGLVAAGSMLGTGGMMPMPNRWLSSMLARCRGGGRNRRGAR